MQILPSDQPLQITWITRGVDRIGLSNDFAAAQNAAIQGECVDWHSCPREVCICRPEGSCSL